MHRNPISFSGVITSTTPDGSAAIVRLDTPVEGATFAVISPETKGRIAVMNGVGRLKPATHVRGQAEKGPEALRAIYVEIPK